MQAKNEKRKRLEADQQSQQSNETVTTVDVATLYANKDSYNAIIEKF